MNNYQIQALQCCNKSETLYEDAQHAGYGLMTEVGELLDTYKRNKFYKTPLDNKNLIEEVGDILWYLSLGYHSINMEMPASPPGTGSMDPVPLDILLAKFAHHAANFFSIVHMYKNSWEDEQLDYDLTRIYAYLNVYVQQELVITIVEAGNINLEKLAKRYPDMVFSTEKALNRDVVNELSHIEEKE